MVQIYIVEDHPVMRQSLRALLDQQKDMAVCGEASTAETALEQIDGAAPDLVLIDVALPGTSGIELARSLHARHPDLAMVMFSGHREKSHVDQALKAGARGYIVKGSAGELAAAIRRVVGGERYLSPEIDG
jgi:DNA-binding NarL/FixJ family response regulator